VQALFSNTSGDLNTVTGFAALFHNTTGSQNCAFGANALAANINGHNNSAFGYAALASNTQGGGNTANGYQALSSNIDGVNNTATGISALFANLGSNNTADGAAALALNHGGTDNTAVGAEALLNNTSGNFNTAIGWETLVANDNGGANTAIGYQALFHNTSGNNNTAIGNGAGANVNAGSFNVYLGAFLGGVPDEVGHTYISNINSTVQPPGGNVEFVTINLDTKLLGHSSSSRRYKEDIKPMTIASEALYRLQPVSYHYRKEIDPNQSTAFGLIAEEVAQVNPALVARNPKGQPESVHYEMVNAMLLNEFLKEHKTVQQQASEIQEQKAAINALKKGMETVVARLKKQDSRIKGLKTQFQTQNPTQNVAANQP